MAWWLVAGCWVGPSDIDDVIGPPSPSDSGATTPSCTDPTELLRDGGFELGPDTPAWEARSDAAGTPVCAVATCGVSGTAGPRTGAWWVWFGGLQEPESAWVIQRDIRLSPGEATLTFWLRVPERSSDPADLFTLLVDGWTTWELSTADAGDYTAAYVPLTFDLTDRADGNLHEVAFYGTTSGVTTAQTSFFLDDVSLVGCP